MFRTAIVRLRHLLSTVLRRAGLVTRGQLHCLHNDLAKLNSRADLLHQQLKRIQSELMTLAGEVARRSDLDDFDTRTTASSLRVTELLDWLAKEPWGAREAPDGPLVSVILPVRDRRDVLPAAIKSVKNQSYPNWELLVIDDGGPPIESDDDARIRYLKNRGRGVSAARNTGLESANGQFIAYLDSDNTMAPRYLAAAVAALQRHPEAPGVYAAQLVTSPDGRPDTIRFPTFCPVAMAQANQIDINVFAHRRTGVTEEFDESLERLVDWDMIRRVLRAGPPLAVPTLGGSYTTRETGRISTDVPVGPSFTRIRRKWEQLIDRPLRVLYALWHWPQLTESYVRWEIDYMRRRGVEVVIWTETDRVAAWFDHSTPVRRGSFHAAVTEFRPDVVHGHWLHFADQYSGHCLERGLPLTVRGHGFEFDPGVVNRLRKSDAVRTIYLYPHQARLMDNGIKIGSLSSGFSTDHYFPESKDRRRVVRTAAALPTKDLTTFMDVAERCPEFQFVLIVAPAVDSENYVHELVKENRERGRPVELLVGLTHEESARRVRSAGIYLHTLAANVSVGEPVSIAEAMGTGSYLITRNLEPLRMLVGNAGRCYSSVDEAASLIRETLRWTDAAWQFASNRSLDRAHLNHADHVVFEHLLNDWQHIIQSAGRSRMAA